MFNLQLPKRQRGMTAIGMLMILALIGMVGYAGFMVLPIYLETTKVDAVLDDVSKNFSGKPTNIGAIRIAIGKRLDIESVTSVDAKDFVIKPGNRNLQVSVAYDREVRYAGNLYLLVRHEKMVEVGQ